MESKKIEQAPQTFFSQEGTDAEKAIRIYETILATTDDFAYIFDTEGRFLYANARLLKVWAKTLNEVVGKTCYDLNYPAWHADMHMREIAEVIKTKASIRGEVPFTGDSGISGIYDYIFQPVFNASGEVEVIIGTTRDVTERKRDEEKLQSVTFELQAALEAKSESEQRYRFLADSVPQIAWTARPDGSLDYYNRKGLEYAGTTVKEMEKVGWGYFVHPDDLSQTARIWQKSLETGCDYETEFRLKRASDQTYRWHLVRALPRRNLKGEIVQWFGTCTDIDDSKLLQAKADEALSRIAAIVESSDDAIISKTLEGIITSWNQGAERIFGHTAQEAIGQHIFLVIPPELQHEEPVIISRLKRGERIEHYETIRVRKDGRRVDISLSVSPLKDQTGNIVGASKIARDITEEKKGAAQRKAELERLVQERTLSLREAVTQMEEFSYSVSHDLRAPLRAMQGYAAVLLEDYKSKPLDADGQEYLQRIVAAGLRMDRLTHDVLVYSKIPRTEMKLHAVVLDNIVRDIVQQYRQANAAIADIIMETPLLAVVGNESFLSQAVSNLVDNAVKFADKGRRLSVHLRTEQRGDQVRLWIEDNGIGILPEHQSRIWGMFERVHPQHMYEGTGIGLAIVRKTVERMNGTMGVESDGASGSKFWIQLPGAEPLVK